MEYVKLQLHLLREARWKLATCDARGASVSLLAYCADLENSGRIEACAGWSDSQWVAVCAVPKRSVLAAIESGLCAWAGNDLICNLYDHQGHAQLAVQRKQGPFGKLGGRPASAPKPSSSSSNPASTETLRVTPRVLPGNPKGYPKGFETETLQSPKGSEDITPRPDQTRPVQTIPDNTPTPLASSETLEAETSTFAFPGSSQSEAGPTAPKPKPSAKPLPVPADFPPAIAARLLAVADLMRRRPTTPWKAEELAAFSAMRLDTCTDAEFAEDLSPLADYYALKLDPERDYRRRDLLTLLRNWPDDVSKASVRVAEERHRVDPDNIGAAS